MTDLLQSDPPTTSPLDATPATAVQPAPPTRPLRSLMAGRYGAATLAAASVTLLAAVLADVVNVTFTSGGASTTVFEQRGYETDDGRLLAGLAAYSLLVALFGWHRRRTRWLLLALPSTVMAVVGGAIDISDELDRIARVNHEMVAAGVPVHGDAGAGNLLWAIGAAGMLAATVLAVVRR
jgi:hypothetical protein